MSFQNIGQTPITPASTNDTASKRVTYAAGGALATGVGAALQWKTFKGDNKLLDKILSHKDGFFKGITNTVKENPRAIINSVGLEVGALGLLMLGVGALGRAISGKPPENKNKNP